MHDGFPMTPLLLLIEDLPAMTSLVEMVSKQLGWQVKSADTVQGGLDLARHSPEAFTMVLLDMHLPDGSGEEVLVVLKTLRPDLPVVLFSGSYDQEEGERLAQSLGAGGYLTKPFTLKQLRGCLARYQGGEV